MNLRLIGYVTGIVDGEGHIGAYNQRGPWGPYARISVSMTDLDPLLACQRLLGGKVTGPYLHKGKIKQHWVWQITRFEEVMYATGLLWDMLSPRRQERLAEVLLADCRRGRAHYGRVA